MNELNHITHNVTSWSQPHFEPFSQEVISTQLNPADMLNTMSEWTQITDQRLFIAATPQIDFRTTGSEITEPSTSFNTDLTQAACSNYPISLIQELRPSKKHLEWAENQDVIPAATDHNPSIPSTVCYTVEDPYFGPESPPVSNNHSVMNSVIHEAWMENPCSTIPSLTLNNQVLELPKHDCNDKGMKTYGYFSNSFLKTINDASLMIISCVSFNVLWWRRSSSFARANPTVIYTGRWNERLVQLKV